MSVRTPYPGAGEILQQPWEPVAGVPEHRLAVERAARAAWRLCEAGFAAAAVFLLTGAVVPLLIRDGAGGGVDLSDGDATIRTLFMGVYAITLALAFLRWKGVLRALTTDLPVLALLGVAAFSAVWSPVPDLTVQRAVALILTTVFGYYLAVRFSALDVLRILAIGLMATMVASAFFGIWLPELGISAGATEGAWQGVFVHKNTLGKYTALTIILLVLLARSERRWRRWVVVACLPLCAALLVLSRSQSAMVVTATLVPMLPLLGVVRWRTREGAPVLAATVMIAGAIAMVIVSNLDIALAAIGRDATFTGRTALWAAVASAATERPMLGIGYSAFWAPGSAEADLVRDAAGWSAEGSHNGFLDLLLELGSVGLVLSLLALLFAARAALRLLRADTAPEAGWPLLVLTFVFLTNLSEGGILRQNNLIWILYVAAATVAYRWAPRSSSSRRKRQSAGVDVTLARR